MKRQGISLVMLFVTIALASAQVEAGAFCTILVSGREGESVEVTAEIRDFDVSRGRLRIRVRNRLRDDDIEILSVEVVGKNVRGTEIKRTISANDLIMPDGYDGIIPHRSDRIEITIEGLTLFRSVSGVTVYSDICDYL